MVHRWFVIRTESRAEYLAVDALERDGFQTYFPRIKAAYPRVGHANTPLFPGYMFLRLDPESDGWPTFRPSHKIVGYVRSGDEIPSLPDEVLNDLIERVSSINDEGELPISVQQGDLVEVTMSSFNAVAEVLESGKSRKGNIKVLLEFMGRLIHADVPWQHVQPVTPQIRPANDDSDNGPSRTTRRTRGKGRWIRGAPKLVGAAR
jgi:transcriptional antiterminator RfaH